MTKNDKEFLCRKMKRLREKNGIKSLEAMKELLSNCGNNDYLVYNRSTLSRVESGSAGEKTITKWAKAYCDVLGYSEKQTEQFLRGDKIVVPDTSALIKNPQLIDELSEEYNIVLIPDIIYNEIEKLIYSTDYPEAINKKANETIKRISVGERIIQIKYSGDLNLPFEKKLINVTKDAIDKYNCKADIITDDAFYPVNGDGIKVIHLREYLSTKQGLINMKDYLKIQDFFSDDYSKLERLDKVEINAFNDMGYTLIISTIYEREHSFEEKKAKIKWLTKNDADVNKRDCNSKYFPPLTHAILENDYQMVLFLLNDCKADPNVASKSPYSTVENRHKNEGNVPLMVAAWEGRVDCLKALLSDSRTSINQQDSNGFTALIKAAANGEKECIKALKDAGADVKIVDHDGKDYKAWYRIFLDDGPLRERFKSKNRGDDLDS